MSIRLNSSQFISIRCFVWVQLTWFGWCLNLFQLPHPGSSMQVPQLMLVYPFNPIGIHPIQSPRLPKKNIQKRMVSPMMSHESPKFIAEIPRKIQARNSAWPWRAPCTIATAPWSCWTTCSQPWMRTPRDTSCSMARLARGVPWEPQNEWFIMEKILLKWMIMGVLPCQETSVMGISLSFDVKQSWTCQFDGMIEKSYFCWWFFSGWFMAMGLGFTTIKVSKNVEKTLHWRS